MSAIRLVPRTPRLLAPWVGSPGADSAIYHCVSRVVNREKVLTDLDKEEFVRLMRRYEAFCGVRVITYCVMSNHFHLLVEVPPRPAHGLSDQELVQRVLQRGGKLGPAEMLNCRVRAFTDGAVIGTKKFLEEFFDARRDFFGPKRKNGARPIYGCDSELCAARGLRKNALG